MANEPQEIQIRVSEQDYKGHYANALQVWQSPEEFVMDFIFVQGPQGQLVSRVITSPAHMKRILGVIQEQLKLYEESHGAVEPSEQPKRMGFVKG